MEHSLELITIGIYLIFLLGIGKIFAHLNKDISDYVRGGAKGSWWMVGMSGLMASLSAFTFTGNAGGIFQAVPSPLIIYLAGSLSGIIFVAFLAAWFRQTRAFTLQDIIRRRFGPEVEQLSSYQAIILGPLHAAVQLWALAVFCGAMFGFPVVPTIFIIGVVVVFYSTSGGKWAVMATDFFQSLILFPIAVVVAVLCLVKVGGIGAFLNHMSDPGIAEDYAFINEAGRWPMDRFSMKWMVTIFISSFIGQLSFAYAGRYLAVKDGREASKAALLNLILGTACIALWFIPPMTARFLIADEVLAAGLNEPHTASYALIAQHVLPNGLIGILIVAMFAATMSSMDSGLNGLTGTVVRNMLPPVLRRLGFRPIEERNQILWCRSITLILGAVIITYAILLGTQDHIELFDIFFVISAVIGLPLGLPFIISIFIRKLPRWSYFSIAGCALVPSIWAFIDKQLNGTVWNVQDRIIWILVAGVTGTVLSRPFFRFSSENYKKQIDDFFADMRRPVDYMHEVGGNCDVKQLEIMGYVTLVGFCFMCLLMLIPNPWTGRLAIACICAFLFLMGQLLLHTARKHKKRQGDTGRSS